MTAIVGSVGTDHHPFPRLLEWTATASEQLGLDAIVQRGATPAIAGIETFEYLPADDLATLMQAARVVVCHGGPGTMSLAIRCGHRPVVLARDPELGEHVDDHQQRYTRRLHAEGAIDLPATREEFVRLVAAASEREAAPVGLDDPAAAAVAAFGALLDQLLEGALPRRPWRERFLLRRVP